MQAAGWPEHVPWHVATQNYFSLFRHVPIANFRSFPKGGFTWPGRFTQRLLGRIGLVLDVGCFLELERLNAGNVAVTGNMFSVPF